MMRLVCGFATFVTLCAAGGAHAQGTRNVTYSDRAVIPVQTKLRFTTLIVLPEGERILDYVCGDKDYWVVSGAENLAYVKPAKAGASTNLNLVTATGRVYSFLLIEGGEPDLKVYVETDLAEAETARPTRFVPAEELEAAHRATETARRELKDAQASGEAALRDAVGKARAAYPLQLRFSYQFRPNEPPFFVSAVFHDGAFTYLYTGARELPALYELRDDAPTLVPFQVERGVYVVPHVVQRGYLALGKRRWFFAQSEGR